MKFVITGAAGHVSKPLTELLLKKGHDVTVVGRSPKNLEGLVSSAIRANGVKNAVFLSSYGAHRLDDAGAISGMGLAEGVLNKLDGVNVLSLRGGYRDCEILRSWRVISIAEMLPAPRINDMLHRVTFEPAWESPRSQGGWYYTADDYFQHPRMGIGTHPNRFALAIAAWA